MFYLINLIIFVNTYAYSEFAGSIKNIPRINRFIGLVIGDSIMTGYVKGVHKAKILFFNISLAFIW